jgi:hypothetical protein
VVNHLNERWSKLIHKSLTSTGGKKSRAEGGMRAAVVESQPSAKQAVLASKATIFRSSKEAIAARYIHSSLQFEGSPGDEKSLDLDAKTRYDEVANHLANRSSESDGGGQRPHMTVQSPSQAPALPENHLDFKDNEITLHSDEGDNDEEPGDFARRADERRKAGRAR